MKYYYKGYYRHFVAFRFNLNYYAMGSRRSKYRILPAPWENEKGQYIHGLSPKWDIPLELYKGNFTFLYIDNNSYYTKAFKF